MQTTTKAARVTLTELAARLAGGGFTVTRGRREIPRSGFVTSCHKPSEVVVRLSDGVLLRKGGKPVDGTFAFQSLERAIGWWLNWTAKAPAEATHVGGWIARNDAGDRCLYLDRTKVCETKDEALAIARRLREKAIFDLGTGTEIEVTEEVAA